MRRIRWLLVQRIWLGALAAPIFSIPGKFDSPAIMALLVVLALLVAVVCTAIWSNKDTRKAAALAVLILLRRNADNSDLSYVIKKALGREPDTADERSRAYDHSEDQKQRTDQGQASPGSWRRRHQLGQDQQMLRRHGIPPLRRRR
jgi:hypothetical protein